MLRVVLSLSKDDTWVGLSRIQRPWLTGSKPHSEFALPRSARRWVRWNRGRAVGAGVPVCVAAAYYYVTFARLIDARLHGEARRVFPRVFARPLELRRGQSLTDRQLIDRLNDLGYAQRGKVDKPGEFSIATGAVSIMPRGAELKGQVVRVVFQRQPTVDPKRAPRRPPPKPSGQVLALELGTNRSERVTLDAPVLTALNSGEREKRRPVALSAIPDRMVQAVLSIEDRRYYDHPGIDPIGMLGALFSYATGRRTYLAGGSTITQQLVRNVFLPKFGGMSLQEARARSAKRKLLEIWVSIILTQRASKDEILELYLNDIPLGQRGSFAISGIPEAARLFFGKDISNVTLAEAATIAGVIQQPSALSPFSNANRCKERRKRRASGHGGLGYVQQELADRAALEPLRRQRALEADPLLRGLRRPDALGPVPGLTTKENQAVDVYTTLDLHLQRLAQDAVRDGLTRVDQLLSRRRRRGKAEAALIAADPRTGEILAFVGGRSYNQSQYNRAVVSRRQPGSVFKPFVYLTAFESALDQGRHDVTAASIVNDEPETFEFDDQVWTPENYEKEYDGPITFRRALAHSRNLATIHVAQAAGTITSKSYGRDRVAPRPRVSVHRVGRSKTRRTNRDRLHAVRRRNDPPDQHILRITRGGKT